MNGYDTSPTPRSPEAYQKRNSSVNNYNYPEDDVAKRVFHIDTLHVNKEKKLLFNKIDTDDSNYFPFGTPGKLVFFLLLVFILIDFRRDVRILNKFQQNDCLIATLMIIHVNYCLKSSGRNLKNCTLFVER